MHAWPGAAQEKASGEPKVKVILQNRRPEFFKAAKDTKGRERWRNYSRLKAMDET